MKKLTTAKQFREEAIWLLRYAYNEEFEEFLQLFLAALPAVTVKRRDKAAHRARLALVAEKPKEYEDLLGQLRVEAGLSRSTWKPQPCELRDEMDSMDAMILHERGLNVSEMAKYDSCTKRAVMRALVPQMLNRRTHDGARLTPHAIADLIGADAQEVHLVFNAA